MKKTFALIILSIVLWALAGAPSRCMAQGLATGKPFKGGQLSDVNGTPYDLRPLIGSKTIVIWISDMSPVAEGGIDNIKSLYTSFSDKYVSFFIISTVSRKRTEDFITANQLGIPVLMGGTDPVVRELSGESGAGISPVNNFFIIDKKGILRFKKHFPGITTKSLESELLKHI